MGDENHTEKIENVGLIFSAAIFVLPLAPQSQSPQDPQMSDIESSSNIFGNLLLAISNSRVLQLRWDGGGTKIRAKKIGNVSRALKNV